MLAVTLTWTSVLLELATLLALAYRRRLRRLLALPLLLAAILLSTVVAALWPAAHTWRIWVVRESVHAGLALLLALELAGRIAFRLPGARREARLWIIPALLALGSIVALARSAPPMTGLLPLVNLTLAGLYVGLTLVSHHHLIPVDPLHKTVLHGFSAYLLIYSLGWTLTASDTTLVNAFSPIAFNLLMLALLWAAWRDDTRSDIPESTLLYFWPWRRFEPRAVRPPPAGTTAGAVALRLRHASRDKLQPGFTARAV